MKVLVTGGSGFIGRNLIGRLRRDGHEVSCLDRYEAPFLRQLGVRHFAGDVGEHVLVEEAAAGQDAVVHLACTVIPKTSNDDPFFDVTTNVGGTVRLLDACVKGGVKRFVFISSGGTVYGSGAVTPTPEDAPNNPECSYGITKLTIEKYLRLYRKLKGLSTCTLRFANPYGEYERYRAAQGVVPVFCYRALVGEPIEIWGDGEVRRDFVYIGDAVDAIARALENPAAEGEINVGGGASTSLNELLELIGRTLGHEVVRRYLPGRPFDVPVSFLDVSKAKRVLGWAPTTPAEEGLRRTLEWIGGEMKKGVDGGNAP